ncbi:MAG: DNA-binding response OmpR family regulator [Candidatus Aldehydirespiratoraceae bacterium]|jgi:DNA-binding response OmpR family regulator
MLPTTDPAGAAIYQTKVLVVDDAPEFQLLIEATLTSAGFLVALAEDGKSGLDYARNSEPDVIVLDLGLPGIDGVEVCRRLRTFSDAYVIMLTARDCEVDRLAGLAVGADDYMTKPFSTRELVARVQALMRRPRHSERRTNSEDASHIQGDLRVRPDSREVWVGEQEVSLTKTEFDLLSAFIERPEMVFTKELLLERVWGTGLQRSDHLVQVHIANLRSKIDRGGRSHIKSVRGVGYRLTPIIP